MLLMLERLKNIMCDKLHQKRAVLPYGRLKGCLLTAGREDKSYCTDVFIMTYFFK